ncbi:MAG: STAS domain-containing protein, partial [Nitrospinota bacterium]|nr:STAS domain-containing protein [Nitrospinota bacterium]
YASSGSFTRSGVNYSAGAKTPFSAVFSAVSLALILLLIAPLAAYLPIASMGGVVLLVAYNLIDTHHVRNILKASGSDSAVLITTFLSTLFVELEFAIYVGVMLSLVLYLNRTSKPRIVARTPDPKVENRSFVTDPDAEECPQFKIIRIDGSIYFGSVNHVQRALEWIRTEEPERRHMMLVCSGINFLDVAGAETLEKEAVRYRSMGGALYLYGPKAQVQDILGKGGYMSSIGAENIFTSKRVALDSIIRKLDPARCARCTTRIFKECADMPNNSEGKN